MVLLNDQYSRIRAAKTARIRDGEVFTVGKTKYGKLGIGGNADRDQQVLQPVPVDFEGDTPPRIVNAAAGWHPPFTEGLSIPIFIYIHTIYFK